eukprot:Gregarina_sp_Poly_1__10773@NODE_826_length_6116_cov_38_033229_g598_i0_p4_GENE_NODE_826_length_6116_cov_38_033229_g598_i0NODE_826_length_6116_cov_38_033229_g598_i0_p4_ORF_typecomplete_len113_score3_69DNApol_Exo/PF18136_1/0_16_NODE_826_length_6116_cov_38_033229_g598_i018762214
MHTAALVESRCATLDRNRCTVSWTSRALCSVSGNLRCISGVHVRSLSVITPRNCNASVVGSSLHVGYDRQSIDDFFSLTARQKDPAAAFTFSIISANFCKSILESSGRLRKI